MARRKTVTPINLDKALKEVLDEYGEDVYRVLGTGIKEVSDEAVRKLQEVKHFAPGRNPSGAYSRDWVAEDVKKTKFEQKRVVHNESHYQLAHLLEKGHVSRNGTGRTFGSVRAYPHVADVEKWAQDELPRRVEKLIGTIQ